jgi:hypothetical protein
VRSGLQPFPKVSQTGRLESPHHEEGALSAEMRGCTLHKHGTILNPPRFCRRDWVALAVAAVYFTGFVFLDLFMPWSALNII